MSDYDILRLEAKVRELERRIENLEDDQRQAVDDLDARKASRNHYPEEEV